MSEVPVPQGFRIVKKGDPDFDAVRALVKQLSAVCSEFNMDQVIVALSDVVGRYFLGVKTAHQGKVWEHFAMMVSESMDIYQKAEAEGGEETEDGQ